MEKHEPVFTKEQLLGAESYRGKQDLLHVLLQKDEQYTLKQVDELIVNFMEKKVD